MKKARCFNIEFPQEHTDLGALVEHLNNTCDPLRYKPLSVLKDEPSEDNEEGFSLMLSTEGLVPVFDDEDSPLFERLVNGFAFAVKMEEKIIPPSAVAEEIEQAASRIAKATGVIPSPKEKKSLHDTVVGTLAVRALSRVRTVVCFYHWKSKRLFVPLDSTGKAALVAGLLLKAFPSVKSQTVHVNSMKDGLATRLSEWLSDWLQDEGEDYKSPFAPFSLGDKVTLKGAESKKVTVDAGTVGIDDFRDILRNAMNLGCMKVASLQFQHTVGDVSFTLSSDFKLSAIDVGEMEVEHSEDPREQILTQYAANLHMVSSIVDGILEMLGWDDPAATGGEVSSEPN